MDRAHILDRLSSAEETFDVLVIGGGATGLGAAVDAAARGHRTALIEQADFSKGTSSRSTKLIHGGVRYLRQGNLSLVLESLHERGLLAHNAPHLVHNLAFVIPTYSWWEGPFYGVGMKVYDRLAGRLGLSPSHLLSREQTIALIPTVETAGLLGGVVYYDGQFDDSRLAVSLAQTADSLGAAVLNYCAAVGLIKEHGAVVGIQARDAETDAEFEIRARSVINATGIFVDALRSMDDPAAERLVAVSQGIHLVLPREFLPGNAAIMVPRTADGRVLFAVPWHDRVVVGTTDTPRSVHELEPRALPAERNFVMEHARRYLAKSPRDQDVLSVFAGLRPLVLDSKAPNTAALSRDHLILVSSSGLITITGGKWTTYRKMAEDVIDHGEMVAGLERRRSPTETLQIHGWTHAPISEKNLQPYGADAPRIADLFESDPALAAPIHLRLPYQRGEVLWHARQEMARTVEDVLARRTRALFIDAQASIEAAPAVAQLLAGELGHDRAWCEAQVEAYRSLARGYIFTDPASTARST
ncbi:MAG: glycerol-3-phosphate dehydrogenase/oxidase [Opitutaceae bacterium]|nr:glycerol-3-phosphate dehydrogenase/oxidase [Opitutaceae bacterium]